MLLVTDILAALPGYTPPTDWQASGFFAALWEILPEWEIFIIGTVLLVLGIRAAQRALYGAYGWSAADMYKRVGKVRFRFR